MATADQVKALIRCQAEGDDARFYAAAIPVGAQAARRGQERCSQQLRDLVDQVKARSSAFEVTCGPKPVPLAQPRGEVAGLLTVSSPKTRIADKALPGGLRKRIESVLTEQRERDRVREHGFSPMRKLLLVRPPGTGKTIRADQKSCGSWGSGRLSIGRPVVICAQPGRFAFFSSICGTSP